MREASRTLRWLALLLVVVVLGDRLGAWLCREVLLRSEFRFSRVYRSGSQAAVIAIGDSRGVHSFYAPSIARAVGRPVLNLSFNSLSMPVAEALLDDYLERQTPPSLVVIEPTCLVLERGLFAELGTYAELSPRLAALFARASPRAAAATRVFRLLRYDSEFFLRALVYLRRSDQDWINHGVIAPELAAESGRWSLQPRPEGLEALGRMVTRLRSRGVEVRVVAAPYYPASHVDSAPLFAALARTLGPPTPQVSFWDYTHAISDTASFADRVHLNADGSERLLRLMLQDGVLKGATAGAVESR